MQVEPRIRAWIENIALPRRRVVASKTLTGGYSNTNVHVVMDDGGEFVLRQYVRANSCAVEAALADRLTGLVPVAEAVAADPDGAEAGEPVLLSVFMPGRPMAEILPTLDRSDADELGRSVGAALAAIGSVTFDAPGFFSGSDLVPGPPGMEPTAGLDEFVDRRLAEGNASGYLTEAEQDGLRRFAADSVPAMAALRGARQLVHADFNPKNMLADRLGEHWRLTAVLDWEFAFSSSPLYDIGNLTRDERPAGFLDGFLAGYIDHGGDLPADWRRLSQALDLYSLADLLTRPVDHRYFQRAVTRIRALVTG
jgi:aminoglycoside phosphotransferase (APT) family kinase protein